MRFSILTTAGFSFPKAIPPKVLSWPDEAQEAKEKVPDARKPKKKGQEQIVGMVDSAATVGESKDAAVAADLRLTKSAGEALLRPSATDGLIARASKMSMPSLFDKKTTALRRTRGVAGAEVSCAKGQDEIDWILKDAGHSSDGAPGHGDIVPLNNIHNTLTDPVHPCRLAKQRPSRSPYCGQS